jgi:predicted PurR-regulated permease PerM
VRRGVRTVPRGMSVPEPQERTLPPPWDRIFSLATRMFVWGLLIVVLGTLFATGFTLVPQVQEQANAFLRNKDKYIEDADKELDKFLRQYPSFYKGLAKHQGEGIDTSALPGQQPTMRVPGMTPRPVPVSETPVGPETGEDPPDTLPPQDPRVVDPNKPPEPPPVEPGKTVDPQQPVDPAKVGEPAKPGEAERPPEKLHIVRDFVASAAESLAKNPLEIVQSGLGYASSFLLALLFSFLIVLDLPKLKRAIQTLSTTKIGFIYDEVADNIAGFGRVLGRALEAQLFIAICNTILTAIGIWIMGIDNILVLSTIVFFCSFIPVVGTFISSTPICLLALQSDGVGAMVLVIVMICVIHAIETYILNPQIYGHHMHMNPVLVLIVLVIGGKLFGVWGLVLGIPIVNYVFRHAIRRPGERPVET